MAKREGVMLAHPAEERRIKLLGPDCIVQPKLKGVRIRCNSNQEGCKLYSSSAKEKVFLNHIREAMTKLPAGTWDGELYKHGMMENDINSRAARTVNPHPDEAALEYHIFDYITTEPIIQKERAFFLMELMNLLRSHPGGENESFPIKIVPSYLARTDDWGIFLNSFMGAGYEGIMFRDLKGTYQDKRSPYLLKFKPQETDCYLIVGMEQGTGWCYDRLGSFIVRDKNGNEFGVGTGKLLTAEERLALWFRRPEIINKKYLLVKHELLRTKNDLPQCAVAWEVVDKPENHEDVE